MSQLLQVRDLSKFFGGLAAIHELEFHVNQGEILSIIGPNRAGKTFSSPDTSSFHIGFDLLIYLLAGGVATMPARSSGRSS
jgi:ABC-type uncharacterized transport system ATPase subunit